MIHYYVYAHLYLCANIPVRVAVDPREALSLNGTHLYNHFSQWKASNSPHGRYDSSLSLSFQSSVGVSLCTQSSSDNCL